MVKEDNMMHNDQFTEKLSLWLDDQLSSSEVQEMEEHLRDCPECRSCYQTMQNIHLMFQTSTNEVAQPVPGFAERFEARLAQRSANRKTTALAVVVLLVGTILLSGVMLSGTAGSIALIISSLSVGFLQNTQIIFIEQVNLLASLLNLGTVFIKACLITMTYPLFWATTALSMGLTAMWIRFMKMLYRHQSISLPILA